MANTNAVANAKNTDIALTEEVNTLLPLVDKFAQLFPNEANQEEDKRLIMNFALALNGVRTKTGQPAVRVCTKESIVQCGLDILQKKLDLSKNQVYLIAYGDKLQLQDSYFEHNLNIFLCSIFGIVFDISLFSFIN